MTHRVVAIDGPAASGKTTVSRRVARELAFAFVSSGLMYRQFTLRALRAGVDPTNATALVDLLGGTRFELGREEGEIFLLVDGHRASAAELASATVNEAVSHVAKVPEVRDALVAQQRACAAKDDVVMEGRDIGSVVFPDTPYKLYLDASPEVRARRRAGEGGVDAVTERDRIDSQRRHSPLKIADGAIVIDSSDLTLAEVVALSLEHLARLGLASRQS